jgi:hypothetical protein
LKIESFESPQGQGASSMICDNDNDYGIIYMYNDGSIYTKDMKNKQILRDKSFETKENPKTLQTTFKLLNLPPLI